MNVTPWQLYRMPSVTASLAEFNHHVSKMRRWGVVYDHESGESRQRTGKIVWGTECEPGAVALAWEWGDVAECVPALSDPMTILSNVVLLNEDGSPVEGTRRLLVLNSALHTLDWQRSIPKRKQMFREDTLLAA